MQVEWSNKDSLEMPTTTMNDYKNDPMRRLVYKHDVIIALNMNIDEPIDFVEALENVPVVDAVKVVRCKDCLYMHTNKHNGQLSCNRRMIGIVKPTDYCSYGENAEEQEESEIINARKGEE